MIRWLGIIALLVVTYHLLLADGGGINPYYM